MPPDPAKPPVPAPPAAGEASPPVGRIALFRAFLRIGLMGFGGVAPFARRVIVEERRWLSERDYAEVLGVGQVLPGANTVNAAVIIGDRFQGAAGSVIAVLSLLAAPLVILVALATLYDRFAGLPDVRAGLDGVAAGAAGLVLGTGVKMAIRARPDAPALALGGAALVAVAFLHLSLVATVLVLALLGLAAATLSRRRRTRP